MKKYDLIVIGTGVGIPIIDNALKRGFQCALIEKSRFGGTCLNRGCIPSKILAYPADVIRQVQKSKKLGLSFQELNLDWNQLAERMKGKIAYSDEIEKRFVDHEGLTVYRGVGEFIDDNTIRVMMENGVYSEELQGKKIVVAPGARSLMPPIHGLEETEYLTSESFYGDSFPEKPWESLVIIGGGVIGVEFAHIFSAYGTKVTILEMQDRLLPSEEKEISEQLEKQFVEAGIKVCVNFRVDRLEGSGDAKRVVGTSLVTGAELTVRCQEIMLAAGLTSNADLLKIENTSIQTDEHGWIKTNEYLETTTKNVWALGDINGFFQFRHKGNYEMFACVHNMFEVDKPKKVMNYSIVPWAIFTHPQIAHLGITEEEALCERKRIQVGKSHYSSVAKGYAMGYDEMDSDDGFVKLILDEDSRILGAHIIGPNAAILIQPYVYLMSMGCRCNGDLSEGISFDFMHDAMVIHPSLSELTGWIFGRLQWVESPKE